MLKWISMLVVGVAVIAAALSGISVALPYYTGKCFNTFNVDTGTVNTELLCTEVRKKLMTEHIPQDILTMIKVYCYGTVRYTCEWLLEDMPLSREAYADVMEKCLPEALRQYLYP